MSKHVSDPAWPMDELQKALRNALRADSDLSNVSPEDFQRVIQKTSKIIGKYLIKRAPKKLAQERKKHTNFEARNFRRWRDAFDRMELIWVCCEEIGRNFNLHFKPEAIRTQDYIFEAMTHLHAKALLVVSEMICLMKGGFADGALTRWRTLYEINVISTLILRGDQELALRYLVHAYVQSTKYFAADDENDEKRRVLKERSDQAVARFGEELKNTNGWACALTGKKKPTFEDLEKLADKTEGRQLYKHASLHIHVNHRAADDLLGTSESDKTVLLVGPSNSGMVEPLTLASLNLVEITSHLMLTRRNFDRVIFSATLLRLAGQINKLARKIERHTLKAFRKKRGIYYTAKS